jgi:dsRNA-specific ribonuclease/transposase-like protein
MSDKLKLPFSRTFIEGALEFRKGALLLTRDDTFHVVSKKRTMNGIYGKTTGALKKLSDELGEIVACLNETNYEKVHRNWWVALMRGVVSYRVDNPDVGNPELYERIYDDHLEVFRSAFTTEEVDSANNYENLEFIGDSVFKHSLVEYFWSERNIRNKSIATVLKHTFENTKALSDLAQIFHMGALVRKSADTEKHDDEIHEDVFEACMGVLREVQRMIQRNPSFPESALFTSDSGFANRIVRLVFENSGVTLTHFVPSKTFITSLSWQFERGSEKIQVTEKFSLASTTISIKTPLSVTSEMAHSFQCDTAALHSVLNATYSAAEANVHAKLFSQIVHDDLVHKLAKLGITQQSVQNLKNRIIVPRELHPFLDRISAAATAKGYWIGFNVQKKTNGISATLYHNQPDRTLRKFGLEFVSPADRLRAVDQILRKMEKIVETSSKIDSARELKYSDIQEATVGDGGGESSNAGGAAKSGTLNVNSRWTAKVAMSASKTSKLIVYSGTAGQNLGETSAPLEVRLAKVGYIFDPRKIAETIEKLSTTNVTVNDPIRFAFISSAAPCAIEIFVLAPCKFNFNIHGEMPKGVQDLLIKHVGQFIAAGDVKIIPYSTKFNLELLPGVGTSR